MLKLSPPIPLSKILPRAIQAIYNRIFIAIDPVSYARSIGVNIGQNVKFYGASVGMFGSEPWLITIGDNVHIVSGCNFITHDGGVLILRDKYPSLELTNRISIGNNVYIGLNSTILPGVTIEDNVIIGAGSVVSRDIPSNSVAAGVPAKVIKSLEDYLKKALINSLNLGHLPALEKERALKRFFGITKNLGQ